jgi:hypothetical protein
VENAALPGFSVVLVAAGIAERAKFRNVHNEPFIEKRWEKCDAKVDHRQYDHGQFYLG